MVRYGFLFWLAVCFVAALHAQTSTQVTVAQVDNLFAKWNKPDSPGCALAVLQNGRIVYEHGYGMADLEHDALITPATPFHVASISKQFTAAAILLLAEQGKLSLDDDVRKYIPELPDFGVTIRVHHLLRHTSGLPEQWGLLQLAGWRYSTDLITDADVMSLVTRLRDLNFPPGSEYLYSNTGFTVLGQIVRRVSGQSLREFTTKNIFEPLGMKNTHFRDDHAEIIKGEALGYVPTKDNNTFRLAVTNFDAVGAASLYTTAEDLAKWDENFYSPKIGGPDFARKMTQTEKLTSGETNPYALGLEIWNYRGLSTVEHAGTDLGYRSNIIRFPQQHFSVVCLCNTTANPTMLNRKVADLYLAANLKEAAPATPNEEDSVRLSPEKLAGKDGFYRLRNGGLVMRIVSENGMLQVAEDEERRPLIADHEGHFLLPSVGLPSVIRFEPAEGLAQQLLIESLIDPQQIWDRLPEFTLGSGEEREYAGSYFSDELDAVYRVEDKGGNLVLKRFKYPGQALTPVIRDLFSFRLDPPSQVGVIEFMRDSSGHLSGMTLTTRRVRHLKFSRQRLDSEAPAAR